MTSMADFTDQEWTQLKRAPFVAGMAISLADPGGPIEAFKETSNFIVRHLRGKPECRDLLNEFVATGAQHGQRTPSEERPEPKPLDAP